MHPVLEKRLMKLMVESGTAERLRQEGWQGGRQECAQELFEYLEKGHSIGEAKEMFLTAK